MIAGFDVSANSGAVDFAAAYKAGMRFCWARVGRGRPAAGTDGNGVDLRWPAYRAAARAAGLLVGGYWRFYPDVDLAAQVDRFARGLGDMRGQLIPMLDAEDNPAKLAPGPLTDWYIRAATAVENAVGRRPLLYSYPLFLRDQLEWWRLDRWIRCIAHYSADPARWAQYAVGGASEAWPDHSAVFWQHAGNAQVPWAEGAVDLQRFACRAVDLATFTHRHELLYLVDDDGKLYGPRARWAPLPEGTDERNRQTPRRIIDHTMVGSLGQPPPDPTGTDRYFRRADVGVESTVGIGGFYDGPRLDGEIRQWVECDIVANANLEGDRDPPDCVSAEHSDGTDTDHPDRWKEPFSPRQAESSWQFTAAVCWRYSIPARALMDSCEGRSGIGWHRLGIKGNWTQPYPLSGWQPGCDVFSTSTGKPCPGDARIKQIYYTGIPRVARILDGVAAEQPADTLEEIMAMTPDELEEVLVRAGKRALAESHAQLAESIRYGILLGWRHQEVAARAALAVQTGVDQSVDLQKIVDALPAEPPAPTT